MTDLEDRVSAKENVRRVLRRYDRARYDQGYGHDYACGYAAGALNVPRWVVDMALQLRHEQPITYPIARPA